MAQLENRLSNEMLSRQADYSEKIKQIYSLRMSRQPLAYIDTYGCQQNQADTELILGMLIDMGFALTHNEDIADIAVFNTCAIREHAEMRVFGNVGKLKQMKADNPNFKIIMCGCMAQQEHIRLKVEKSYPFVDVLFGTHALYMFPELLHKNIMTKKRVFDISGDENGKIFEGINVVRGDSVRANLPIMYGCNNFCTYCVVPYVRGRERSRSPEEIVKAFTDIVNKGYKEITLLGQNVNSYGSDKNYDMDFADLLDRLAQISGDFIIRFMTSHPKDASEKLFKVMAKHPKIAKQLHLPFQSGNDGILQRMNRGYTNSEYLKLIENARSLMPNIALSSDVIVGFPGETELEFKDTMSIVRKVGFDQLFTFIFSKRVGTKAYNMPDNVPSVKKQDNFDMLIKEQTEIAYQINVGYIGKVCRVLVDGESFDASYNLSTRTEGGKLVKVRGNKNKIGEFIDVVVDKASPYALFAVEK